MTTLLRALPASSRAPLPENSRLPTFIVNSSSACGIAGGDVGGDGGMVLLRAFDMLRQAFHCQRMLCCWLRWDGAQLVELADFGIDLDLLHHGWIAGGDGLDFGIGERAAFEVFRLADRDAAVHDLLDEPGFVSRHCHI